jgi:hypothetical protein
MDFTRFIFFSSDPFGDAARQFEEYRGYRIEYNHSAICVCSPTTQGWMKWGSPIMGCHSLEQARQLVDWDIAQMQAHLLP